MKQVLVIGPDYFGYTESVARAFLAVGYRAEILNYDNPIHPFRGLNKLRFKLAPDKEQLKRANREQWQPEVRACFDSVKPDIVFILNGDLLTPDTLDHFRAHGSKVVVWMFDNINRFPLCIDNLGHTDLFCCFDSADVCKLRAEGHQVMFLPQACDTARYHTLADVKHDIDILFVGNMWGYERRKELLLDIIRRYGERYNVQIYGRWEYLTKNPLGCIHRPYPQTIHNCIISPEEVNRLYNRARIVLNIHHEAQADGANPKVYEICGAGAYQICNRNPYIDTIYPHDAIGLYSNEEELFDRIDYALAHDMTALAASAHQVVAEAHTFKARIETVLDHII